LTEKKTAAAPASKIIRALDVGWGYTKLSRKCPISGELEFMSFPSLAPRHAGLDLSMSILGRRDTVVVDVDGTKYEVGPDSADLDTSDMTRNLNDQYIHTEQYKAVFFGALAYMNEPTIDMLVVGLPLSNMGAATKLRELMVGTHKVNGDLTVEVKDALVLPQPLGGLYYCMSLKDRPEFEFLDEEVNLVIDPGFLTFDFLLSNGDKVIENRSSAHTGGVSKVLRSIAESISAKFDIRYENLSAIDKGLRRRKIKINGEVESLDDHIRNTRAVLEGSVNFMKNMVGDGSDVDNVILLGGGSSIYRRTIEQYYPKHTLIVLEDAQLANVKGYQMAGEKYMVKGKF
jgi:plasmid segregation protein ParM